MHAMEIVVTYVGLGLRVSASLYGVTLTLQFCVPRPNLLGYFISLLLVVLSVSYHKL